MLIHSIASKNMHKCVMCEKEFYLKPSAAQRLKCCSQKCSKEWKILLGWKNFMKLKHICLVCGKNIMPKKYGEFTAFSFALKKKTCSDKCLYIWKTTPKHEWKNLLYKFKDENYKIFYRQLHKKLRGYRLSAKRKGLGFDLDTEYLVSIFPKDWTCPVYGIVMYFAQEGFQDNSPSLDRNDSTKGYIKGNVTWMSWGANKHKSNLNKTQIHCLNEYMKTI